MRSTLSIILLFLCAAWGLAQNHNDIHLPIYTRVGASYDQEASIYEHPYLGATTIGRLYYCFHGLCPATMIENLGDWYLIDDGGVIGYVRASETELQSWYSGNGKSILIAAKPKTYIYTDYYGEDELQHVDVILQGNRLYEQIPESEYTSYGIGKNLQKSDFGEFIGSITEIGPYSEDVLSTPCSQEPAIAGCEVFYYQPVNCDAVIIVRGKGHCSLFRFMNFTEEGFGYSDNYKVFNVLSADDIARIDYQIEKPDGTLIVKKSEGSITDISDIQSFFNITMALKPYIRENALSGDPEWLNEAREEYKQSGIDNQVYVEASVILKNGLVMDFSYQPNLGTGYIPGHFFLSEEDNAVMRKMF